LKRLRLRGVWIAIIALSAGCRQSESSVGKEGAKLPPGVKEMSLAVVRNRMVGAESKTEAGEVIESPTAADIEKQIKAIDWQDTSLRASVGLGKVDAAGNHSMKVQRVDAKPGMDGVRVLWLTVERGAAVGRETDIDSIDQAVSALQAFYRGDSGLDKMAHWDVLRE